MCIYIYTYSRLRLPIFEIVSACLRADSRRNRCSYVQNTRIRVLPESILRCRNLQMLYAAALRAESRATPAAAPSTHALVCASGITTYSCGPIGVGLPACLSAWGTPSPYSRAVVQARRCDRTGGAAREDRRAQEAEELVRGCAQRALHCACARHAPRSQGVQRKGACIRGILYAEAT